MKPRYFVPTIAFVVAGILSYVLHSGDSVGVFAGLGSAALVVLASQESRKIGLVGTYLAPTAIVGLQAKLVGPCSLCTDATSNAATLVANLMALILLFGVLMDWSRLLPTKNFAVWLALIGLIGQSILLVVWPQLCAACLVATFVLSTNLFQSDRPNWFTARSLWPITAGLSVFVMITAGSAVAGRYAVSTDTQTEFKISEIFPVPPQIPESNDSPFSPEVIVVTTQPDCPACNQAKEFIRRNRPRWVVLSPCTGEDKDVPCWNQREHPLPTPCLFRVDQSGAHLRSRGYDPKLWEQIQ